MAMPGRWGAQAALLLVQKWCSTGLLCGCHGKFYAGSEPRLRYKKWCSKFENKKVYGRRTSGDHNSSLEPSDQFG